ncbi:hypothetical protein LXL04_023745 [Taraxacum kok-saghyz]
MEYAIHKPKNFDFDFGGNIDDGKITSGYVFNFGSGAISWQAKKKSVVAFSSAKVEYISLSVRGSQALWLREILEEINQAQDDATTIYFDNKSTIARCQNPVSHGKSKHIRLKSHFIKELVANSEVEVDFCGTRDQLANFFTKPLQVGSFTSMQARLGVHSLSA